MGQLQDIKPQLSKLGFQIIALSPDKPEGAGELAKKEKLEFRVMSDSDLSAAKAFGVAYKVDDEMDKMLKGYRIDLEQASGKSHRLLAVPAAFVLTRDRVVRFHYANPDYTTRVSSITLLEEARKYAKP